MSVISYKSYSVLMSVYYKEKPEYLKQAMESMINQTVLTNDFVLVCDGPLNAELDAIISEEQEKLGAVLKVIRLKENGGLGNALSQGIKHCKNELVARMDSDDIAYLSRCEMQLKVFNEQPDVSICSGTVEEFFSKIECVEARRILPETNEEIVNFAKKRNPFNHPCVMYKKSAVESVGSYCDFYLLEDYYLWIRLLVAGYKGYNIPKPLLHMRAGRQMYARRSGIKYVKSQYRLFLYMYKSGFITKGSFFTSVVTRGMGGIVPNSLRFFMYKKILRK